MPLCPIDMPAVATTGQAPVPSVPVTPTTRHVVVDSEPPGAEIWRDGARVGTTPHSFELGLGEQGRLELRLEEHETASLELAGAAASQTVTLVPVRRALATAPRTAPRRERPETSEPTAAETATPQPTPPPTPRDPYERFE